MVTQETKSVVLRFTVRPGNGAKNVSLIGDFNNWQASPMESMGDGSFTKTITVSPGSYQYKFVIDGRYVVDPDNTNLAMNSYGTLNSVVDVA